MDCTVCKERQKPLNVRVAEAWLERYNAESLVMTDAFESAVKKSWAEWAERLRNSREEIAIAALWRGIRTDEAPPVPTEILAPGPTAMSRKR